MTTTTSSGSAVLSKSSRGGFPIVSEDKLKEYQSWQLDARGMVSDEVRNAFFKVLRSKPANRACIDCMTRNPVWISTGFGVFVCLNCSGRHRQMGVHVTFVRSCEMDKLPPQYLIQMELGGNERARDYFKQHNMGPGCSKPIDYHGRWAAKYRQMLQKEVDEVMSHLQYDLPPSDSLGDTATSSDSPKAEQRKDTQKPSAEANGRVAATNSGSAAAYHTAAKAPLIVKKSTPPVVIRKNPVAPVVIKARPTPPPHNNTIFSDDAGEVIHVKQVDDFFDRLEKEAAANPRQPASGGSNFARFSSTPSKPAQPSPTTGGFVKEPEQIRAPSSSWAHGTAVASPTISPTHQYNASDASVPDRLRSKRGISSDDFYDALSPSYNENPQSERLPASFATRQSFGSEDLTPGGGRREGNSGMDFDDLKTSAAVAAEKGLQYASKGYEALSSYIRRQGNEF